MWGFYKNEKKSKSYDSIVLGAGPCGIGAASTFLEKGVDNILVLEARDRIGGRAYTREGVDLGAQWIH